MEIKMGNQQFNDKEMLNDALSTQKFLTDDYNSFASECATPAVRDEFMNILNEEHQIQQDIFSEMQKRGWYQVETAEQQKVDQAKQKYTNSNPDQNASQNEMGMGQQSSSMDSKTTVGQNNPLMGNSTQGGTN